MLGEVARVVTTGQKVLPRKAKALGYRFKYPDLEARPPRRLHGQAQTGRPRNP